MTERNLCDMFAQNHPWAEADGHLHDPRLRLLIAHARVLRDEDLTGQDLSAETPPHCAPEEAEYWLVPLRLQSWEARKWDRKFLWRYHEKHSSSNGQASTFPPAHLALPMLVYPRKHQGRPTDISDFGRSETQWTIIDQITVVRGTAEEAIAHHLTINEWEQPEEPAEAAVVDFSEAYPALVCLLGGERAYGRASESHGRLRLWRLLHSMAGSTDIDDINDFVARIRCMTWRDWSDDIWYIHLAIEDPVQRTAWVLDGQDFD
ncbi:hypothetical protein ACFVH4_07090 [Nocardia ignorata]|uniref:hypothetical protein n=1 Tax=Nocardia ignorata TaxID=145285 RepID=UPI0036303F21